MPLPAPPAARRRSQGAAVRRPAAGAALRRGAAAPTTQAQPRSRLASQLLQVDEKRFEFGGSRVRVADEWRERVGEPVPAFARVAVRREPHVAPMNRDADLVHLL